MSALRRFSIVVLVLVATCSLAAAQNTIRGSVVDSVSGETLVGANVYLPGSALGAVTDREGRFIITHVSSGTVNVRASYLGYRVREMKIFLADRDTILVFRLAPDVLEGEEVVVTGQMRGQIAAINQQVTSNTIVNVISEEKIKELPDANAAEAIGRLPGVSIIRSGGEANKVILRGLSDKFTSITINGIRVPATDADSRGVDLSVFSQGTLSGVELFKALTPDKDGDAIAGSINLVTRKAPAVRTLRVDAKGAYNHLTRDAGQYDFNGKYGERFFDNVLGVQVTGNIERRDRSNEQFNTDIEDQLVLNQRGYLFDGLTVNFTDETRKRSGVGLLLDFDTPEGGSIRFDNLFSHTQRNYIQYGRDYPVTDNVFYSARDREQNVDTYSGSVRGNNTLFDLSVIWGGSFAQSKLENPYDYRMWFREDPIDSVSGMANVPRSAQQGPPELLIPYAYNNFVHSSLDTAAFDTERNLEREKTAFLDIAKKYELGDFASGEVKLGGKYRYRNRFKESTERFAPYYLNYFQDYVRNADGSITPKNFAGTRFANLQKVGRLILFTNFLDPTPTQRNLYDKYLLNPIVNRDALREWYELNKNGIGPTGQREYYDNPEVGADYYDILERVQAAYLMNTLNIGSIVTFIAGVRVERESNVYRAKYVNSPLGGFPISGTLLDTVSRYDETDWLPNFHLTVRPTDFMSVRLAAYKAIARPDFNARLEKISARTSNPRNILTIGNPRLKNAKAWNFELNTSLYGNTIGLFSASVFYREIKDMFHTIPGLQGSYEPGNPGSLMDTLGITWRPFSTISPISLTYSVNSDYPTKVWGLEIEHQLNLNFLPGALSGIVLGYNFTFVRSETFILGFHPETTYVVVPGFPLPLEVYHNVYSETKQKLEGQPEFFGNVSLGYDYGGFSGRLSVFYQGEYNRVYSAGRRSDPVVQPFSRWDLSLRQRLTENISIFFNMNNLTSVEEDQYTINRVDNWEAIRSSQRYGLTGDVGVRFEL